MTSKKNLPAKNNNRNELLGLFLENQSKELEQKARQLEFDKQKDKNSFEFAKLALKNQSEDSDKQREHNYKLKKSRFIFATIILGLIFVLFIYSLSIGKEAFASEVLKVISFVGSGGFAGYGFRLYQEKKNA